MAGDRDHALSGRGGQTMSRRASATGPGPGHPLSLLVPSQAPAGQLVALVPAGTLFAAVAGRRDDNDGEPIALSTLFDLASLTKVVTAMAFMRLVEDSAVALRGHVVEVLPAFGGGSATAREVTWWHLLTHSSGLPADPSDPLDQDPVVARRQVLEVPIGRAGLVVYSDVGFMVLGFAIEALTGQRLDRAIRELVTGPAGLESLTYLPSPSRSIAPTELDRLTGRHLRGVVHDENARALGGIAGHAGLFATATDVARLGSVFLRGREGVLGVSTIERMTTEQATGAEGIRRGLGVALWAPDPEATSHPFGPRSFGHTGYTGTSLWVDPERSLVVALLTNAVYRGRSFGSFFASRIEVHRRIVAAADAAASTRAEALHGIA